MKTFKKTIYVVMAIMAVSLTSCSKSDDGGDGGDAGSGIVKAEVEGNSYTSEPTLTSAVRTDSNGTSTLFISGNTMNGKNITLGINGGFEGVGEYIIGGGANVFVNGSYTEVDVNNPTDAQTWQAPFDDSVAGKINISEISSTVVKGTFNFKCKNMNGTFKNIMEGSFNVNIK